MTNQITLNSSIEEMKKAFLDLQIEDVRYTNYIGLVLSVVPTQGITEHSIILSKFKEELNMLSPREKKVLELTFGLEDGINRSFEEVGKEFDVTGERIQQIVLKGIRKLKHPSSLKEFYVPSRKDYLMHQMEKLEHPIVPIEILNNLPEVCCRILKRRGYNTIYDLNHLSDEYLQHTLSLSPTEIAKLRKEAETY